MCCAWYFAKYEIQASHKCGILKRITYKTTVDLVKRLSIVRIRLNFILRHIYNLNKASQLAVEWDTIWDRLEVAILLSVWLWKVCSSVMSTFSYFTLINCLLLIYPVVLLEINVLFSVLSILTNRFSVCLKVVWFVLKVNYELCEVLCVNYYFWWI